MINKWIKALPDDYERHTSFCYGSVMLWQANKVYVMDNHLSAAWCWLQSCDPTKEYNFMHIDRHYDMLECFHDEDLQPLIDNPHMPYDEFKNLKRKKNNDYEKYEVFRWDNYIMATYVLQPDWFHTNIFLTHKEGDIGNSWGHKAFQIREENPLYMDWYINQYIGEPSEFLDGFNGKDYELPWIVNLDLDVFYTVCSPHIQLHSDDYIRYIARLLNDNLTNIQVVTIALSPDCMGGETMKKKWDNSFRILKIMSEELKCLKDFPFPAEEERTIQVME